MTLECLHKVNCEKRGKVLFGEKNLFHQVVIISLCKRKGKSPVCELVETLIWFPGQIIPSGRRGNG